MTFEVKSRRGFVPLLNVRDWLDGFQSTPLLHRGRHRLSSVDRGWLLLRRVRDIRRHRETLSVSSQRSELQVNRDRLRANRTQEASQRFGSERSDMDPVARPARMEPFPPKEAL